MDFIESLNVRGFHPFTNLLEVVSKPEVVNRIKWKAVKKKVGPNKVIEAETVLEK